MTHLIDKDAVMAEIERKRNHEVQWMQRQGYTDYNMGLRDAYVDILSYIESLEVKEVDLKKEIEEHVIGMPMSEFTHDSEVEDYLDWAREEFRHFFELGLKAQKGE